MDHLLTTSCLTCVMFVAFVRVPLSTSKQEGFSMFFLSLEFAINSPQESGMKTQGLGLRHPDQFSLSLKSLRVETDAHVETLLFQCFDTASLNRQISPPRRPKPNFGDRIRCLGDENLGTKVLFAMFWQGRTFFFSRWFKMDHSLATSCLTCCMFVSFVRAPLATSKQEGFWIFFFSLEFVINNPQESGMKTQGLGLRHPDQFSLSLRSLRVETDAHVLTQRASTGKPACRSERCGECQECHSQTLGVGFGVQGMKTLGPRFCLPCFGREERVFFQVVQNRSLADYILFDLQHVCSFCEVTPFNFKTRGFFDVFLQPGVCHQWPTRIRDENLGIGVETPRPVLVIFKVFKG